MAAFVSPGGRPAPAVSLRGAAAAAPRLAPEHPAAAGGAAAVPGPPEAPARGAAGAAGPAALAAAGIGALCLRAAGRRMRRARRHLAAGLRVASLDRTTAPAVQEGLDNVETSIAQFVPKISALQNQAELLRSGELREVIDTLKELRKTELRGVFSEVDQLLCALIDAIDGLRESAQTIRQGEIRQIFEQMESSGQVQAVKIAPAQQNAQGLDTMMEVHVVGLSHHKAPVEVREKLAVPEADWNRYAQELVEFARTPAGYMVPEVAVLSTCNRFELYFASPEMKKGPAVECVHAFLRQKSGLSREGLEPYLFTHSGQAATQHLFEVSSGLDSLVLGEAQILAQVKACHEHCIEKEDAEAGVHVPGSGGKIVAKMLNAGIRMGKLVRTRTKIGKGSVSVSSAAVELMLAKSLPDLRKYANNLQVCVLGAGKMSRLLLIALFSKNPEARVIVVNRSVEKAQAMLKDELVAARGGANATVASWDQFGEVMAKSDVVFTATAAKDPIINPADVQGRDRMLMLIDIAVPRNVAAACGQVEGVFSYDVDDLKKVVQANADKRKSEVLKAQKLIAEEVDKFKVWQASQGAVPYLAALQSMAERIRTEEIEKMSVKLSGLHDKEKEAIDKLTRHIIDQLFRPIYYSMKDDEEVDAKRNKILALKSMFRLEPEYKRRLLPSGSAAGQLSA